MRKELIRFEDLEATYALPELEMIKLYRINVGGKRLYQDQDGNCYLSLTSFIDAVSTGHERKFLESWKRSMRAEMADESVDAYVQKTADYGTLQHIILGDFAKKRKIDWDETTDLIYSELKRFGLPDQTLSIAAKEMIKDLAGLVQFFADKKAEILAVELPVRSTTLKLATQVDFVLSIENEIWCVNLKSGKGTSTDDNVLQLIAEAKMFNECFGSVIGRCTKVANLRPNDWRKEPAYTFKDQTKRAKELAKLFDLKHNLAVELGIIGNAKAEYTYFAGTTHLGQSPTENMVIKEYNY